LLFTFIVGRVVDDRQDLSLGDLSTSTYPEGAHHSGLGSSKFKVHFHRLQHSHYVPLPDQFTL
jgi:hypothetical protein